MDTNPHDHQALATKGCARNRRRATRVGAGCARHTHSGTETAAAATAAGPAATAETTEGCAHRGRRTSLAAGGCRRRRRNRMAAGATALLALSFASACVPTTAPNLRWHACNVPVAGEITPTVDAALKDMTSLTGITFTKSDLVTATYHGIKFQVGDLPGTSTGWAEPSTTKVGGASVAQSGLVIWDHSANPPTARIARHELGHLMGLAHSATPVMRPAPVSTTWTAAERTYLADVGRASGCRS